MIKEKLTRKLRKKLNKTAFRRASGFISASREQFEAERSRVYKVFSILVKNGISEEIAIEALQSPVSESIKKYRELKQQLNKILAMK